MPSINLYIPDKLYKDMQNFKNVNWSLEFQNLVKTMIYKDIINKNRDWLFVTSRSKNA